MPLFIRVIAEKAIAFVTAFLAFVGVSFDTPNVVTPEEGRIDAEERREIIRDLLREDEETQRSKATEPLAVIDESKLPITPIPNQPLPTVPVKTEVVPEETPFEIEDEQPVATEPTPEETLPATISNVVLHIVCTNRDGNRISVSTGSGVLISEQGVVLTNAHVAQTFLLKDYSRPGYMDCTLRRQNSAIGYEADLLYISEDWITENAHLISNPSPRGTGEDDYALLVITGSANPAIALPSTFPAADLSLNDGSVDEGDSVTVAGYPGNQISLLNLNSAGRLDTDRTFITDVYTFARTTTDLMSTGETSVAQKGSSGGGIFRNNKLVGIIATTGAGISENFINGITISYISRDIREETGNSLLSQISGNVISKSEDFLESTAADLLDILERHL